MERLTFDGNFCDISQCRELPCSYNGSCSQRKVWERLKAYEDTHMMPADVMSMRMDMAILTGLFNGIDVDRMREIVAAERDGRVVVLPCKVGQRVFALLDTDKHISECEVKQIVLGNKINFVGLEPIGARGREYGVSLNGFGKAVFLTREEAEAALEAMKNVCP